MIEFLSYESGFGLKAINGPARGMMSTQIGSLLPNTPPGKGLIRVGVGCRAKDFLFAESVLSQDAPNMGQTIAHCVAAKAKGVCSPVPKKKRNYLLVVGGLISLTAVVVGITLPVVL